MIGKIVIGNVLAPPKPAVGVGPCKMAPVAEICQVEVFVAKMIELSASATIPLEDNRADVCTSHTIYETANMSNELTVLAAPQVPANTDQAIVVDELVSNGGKRRSKASQYMREKKPARCGV